MDNSSRLPGQGELLSPVALGTKLVDYLNERLESVTVLYLQAKGIVICMTLGLDLSSPLSSNTSWVMSFLAFLFTIAFSLHLSFYPDEILPLNHMYKYVIHTSPLETLEGQFLRDKNKTKQNKGVLASVL